MSQTTHEDPEGGNAGVCYLSLWPVFSKFTNVNEIDGNQNQSLNQPAPNQSLQSLQGESSFGDSSGPFFSIYSKVAEEEDRKMVERWQKDADGILIFVSTHVDIYAASRIYRNTIDRSILCCCCCAPCRDRPGPEAKQSGYLCILSWEYLRVARRPERNTRIHPLPR